VSGGEVVEYNVLEVVGGQLVGEGDEVLFPGSDQILISGMVPRCLP
jgi:hypothetical protein